MNFLIQVLLALIPVYILATGYQLQLKTTHLQLHEVSQVVNNINTIYGVNGVSVGVFGPLAFSSGGSGGKLLNTSNAIVWRLPYSGNQYVSQDTLDDKFYEVVYNTRFQPREARVNQIWNAVNNEYRFHNKFVSVSSKQNPTRPIIATNARGSVIYEFADAQDFVAIVLN
jgi:hypothetical protein